jgi:hypothetical protein
MAAVEQHQLRYNRLQTLNSDNKLDSSEDNITCDSDGQTYKKMWN